MPVISNMKDIENKFRLNGIASVIPKMIPNIVKKELKGKY